jgi:hypothetical protein
MTDDEMRSTMQFILEQQVRFATNLERLEAAQLRHEEEHVTQEGRLRRLEDAFVQLVSLARSADERLDTLESAQAVASARLAELAQAQKATEERLNIFIATVERFISERGEP